jgi:hypothetical protein
MISHYLSSLTGIEYVGEATLVLSFLLFIAIVVRVFLLDRDRVSRLERLPLDEPSADGKEAAL